jgi:hypothetical protein
MKSWPNYTYEQIINNFEFKTIRKLMIRKFPWIVDIDIRDIDEINDYSIIFLNAVVDPEKIKEAYDVDYGWLIEKLMGNDSEIIDKYLKNRQFLSLSSFMDIGDDDDILRQMRTIYRDVKRNPTIPHDMKLHKNRSFEIESFTISDSFIEKLKNEEQSAEKDLPY